MEDEHVCRKLKYTALPRATYCFYKMAFSLGSWLSTKMFWTDLTDAGATKINDQKYSGVFNRCHSFDVSVEGGDPYLSPSLVFIHIKHLLVGIFQCSNNSRASSLVCE